MGKIEKKQRVHINILLSFNDAYVQHAAVMLCSIFENNKSDIFDIYVMYTGLRPDLMAKLRIFVEDYGNKITYIKVDIANIELPNLEHHYISKEAYLRVFLGDYIPADVNRLIYLDVDTSVIGNIEDLWREDLEGKVIGAIEDSPNDERYARLGLSRDNGYFNTGVQLIDVSLWRKYNFTKEALDFIRNHPDKIIQHDQDVMNVVAQERWKRISFKWNMLNSFFFSPPLVESKYAAELEKAKKDPRIVHFSGGVKPWMAWEKHPYYKEYYKYLELTPWKGFKPSITSRWNAYKFPRNLLTILSLDQLFFGIKRFFEKY